MTEPFLISNSLKKAIEQISGCIIFPEHVGEDERIWHQTQIK